MLLWRAKGYILKWLYHKLAEKLAEKESIALPYEKVQRPFLLPR